MNRNGKRKKSSGTCSRAGHNLATRHTSSAGRTLAKCAGGGCSSFGWRLSVIGSSAAGRGLARCRRPNPLRPLYSIASEIRKDWADPYFGAVPYIEAMSELDKIEDMYGQDEGKDIVLHFLANASRWRGAVAKRVKNELRAMAGIPVKNPHDTGDEDDDGATCPMCGGQGGELGQLGTRIHFQCRGCGWEWSVRDESDDPVEDGRSGTYRVARAGSGVHPAAQGRGRVGSHGFEHVTLDGNMSPSTVKRLKELVRERAKSPFKILAREGGKDAGVLARRKVKQSGYTGEGKAIFLVTPARMVSLLPSLLRGTNAEQSIGNSIASRLGIEVV